MMKTASAIWIGKLNEGSGTISTTSEALNKVHYNFKARIDNDSSDSSHTSPEELIAAAHASSFSMVLSHLLGDAGLHPEHIATQADVTLGKIDHQFEIITSHLIVVARIPDTDKAQFEHIAEKAKIDCPVSKLMRAEITMEVRLQTTEAIK